MTKTEFFSKKFGTDKWVTARKLTAKMRADGYKVIRAAELHAAEDEWAALHDPNALRKQFVEKVALLDSVDCTLSIWNLVLEARRLV